MRRATLALLMLITTSEVVRTGTGPARASETRPDRQDLRGPIVAVTLTPPALPAALAQTMDPVIDALWSRFSRRSALAHVQFISQYWRLSGNVGYNATINRIHQRLVEAGFRDTGDGSVLRKQDPSPETPGLRQADPSPTSSVRVEEYPNSGKGWNYSVGTLAIVHASAPDEVVLSRDKQNLSLCINSFSTPAGGVVAPLVDVGRGREADFTGKDVKGAVVLGDGEPGGLSQTAIAHGAIGVISTGLGGYINPNVPGAASTPREDWNILQWGSIRYDDVKRPFGFKSTPHAAATLRKALATGPVKLRVTIASTFSDGPNRMLIAEIPGKSMPNERVVITAHVQEPGANDNASGVATLAELARAMRLAIRSGAIAQPERTITFLWLEEISGSRQWLTSHADEAKNVRYMFSMDMTGEDVRKTGGSFLIERWPDPGAVWDRPWDPHTEWGKGNVSENQLKGDLLNDVHLAICARVAAKTGWVVKTNPYEGGSDHSEFGRAGIPAVLDWHFTDRYYHSNYDTADKTSPNEMRNVGVSVAASAWLLASANEKTALDVASLVAKAGQTRIEIEEREGQKLADAASDQAGAKTRETTIVQAWRKWYGEAIHSVSRLVVGPASPAFAKTLDDLASGMKSGDGSRLREHTATPEVDLRGRPPGSLLESEQQGRGQRGQGQRGRGAVPAGDVDLNTLLLAVDRLQAERWYPASPATSADPSPDAIVLKQGLASRSPQVRAAAVRAVGRFENVLDAPSLQAFLADPDPNVRREAAQALAQSLKSARGDKVLPAKAALEQSLTSRATARTQLFAPEIRARAAALEALARLRYDHQAALQVAPRLVTTPEYLSILLRQDRLVRLSDDSLQILRRLASPDASLLETDRDVVDETRPRLSLAKDALEALYLMDAVDVTLATTADRYRCGESPACGWEIRLVATQQLDVKNPALASDLDVLRHDAAYQVRIAALTKLATFIPTLQTCRVFL